MFAHSYLLISLLSLIVGTSIGLCEEEELQALILLHIIDRLIIISHTVLRL